MNKRTFRGIVAVVLSAAALTLGTACSTSDEGSKSPSTSAAQKSKDGGDPQGGMDKGDKETGSEPTSAAPPALAKPSVADLNTRLKKAFDPAVDNKEKLSWIQNAEQDPYLVQNLVEAAKKNKVTIEVTNVQEPKDGKLKADAKVTIDGKPVENASIDFIAEGTEWKVANTFACSIVKSAKIESAACQE